MKSFYKNQNLNLIASTAQQIVFNNSKNGKLESTNTQDAIDEISNILDEEKTIISDAWNNSTNYTVGQYCIYNNTLWKCLVQHNGQEPSEGTYWTKTQIDDEILSIKNDVSTINSNLITKAARNWKYLGEGTGVDISSVYSKAFEYFVIFEDETGVATTFLIPYQLLGRIISNGYYYDSKYYACKALSTSSSNILISTNWTNISNNGAISNTGKISVYYR